MKCTNDGMVTSSKKTLKEPLQNPPYLSGGEDLLSHIPTAVNGAAVAGVPSWYHALHSPLKTNGTLLPILPNKTELKVPAGK